MRLLKKERILKSSKPINTPLFRSLVYFLIKQDKIVYIGKCKNGVLRLLQHIKWNNKMLFDKYYFINCNPQDLNKTEDEYIALFKPKYNKLIKVKPLYLMDKK